MRKSVAAVALALAVLGPVANAGAQQMQAAPVTASAVSDTASAVSDTGSAQVVDPLLCAPVLGNIIQLFYNPYGPLLGQICAMR